jgi:hypothetical protein
MAFIVVARMTTATEMSVAKPEKNAGDVTGPTWRAERPGIS